jgi:hypothetical protein
VGDIDGSSRAIWEQVERGIACRTGRAGGKVTAPEINMLIRDAV